MDFHDIEMGNKNAMVTLSELVDPVRYKALSDVTYLICIELK